MSGYVLVIDRGSTNTKAVVFNTRGEEILICARSSPKAVATHPGWWEQDMEAIWQVAAQTIRDVFNAGIAPDEVLGVFPVGQGNGLMAIDKAGAPVRMGIHSLDSRAAGIVAQWQADGRYAKAVEIVGLPFGAGAPLPLLCWLRENNRAEYDTIDKILFSKDWIAYRFCGAICTDPTDASGAGLMDLQSNAYAHDMFEMLGAGFVQDQLPEIRACHEIAGHVTNEAAKQTGLLEGTPVLCGAHDIAACSFGIGAVDPQQLVCAVGTWGLNLAPTKHLDGLPAVMRHTVPGWQLTGVGDGNSGGCLDIMLEMLGVVDYDEAQRMIAGREPTDIIFQPAIFSTGAGFDGICSWHGRADLLLAVYEGIVMGHARNIRLMNGPFKKLWLVGGGAKSPVFGQLFADITGLTVHVPAISEITARGGALNALVGLGVCKDYDEAALPVPAKATFEPNNREFYARKFERFQAQLK